MLEARVRTLKESIYISTKDDSFKFHKTTGSFILLTGR
ncbi:hypothetical protein J2W55_001232 [Mucilaginibacter pocheonensis]|uniref:Uncharacterized protein n=1 Tax=Mucilaginibacter pocheonensis TaxID=398050 RepID=A0ABU1T7Z3_9SPHI|nr:hypothetical protein [Mucilaginibacter pocheonensis]